MEKACAEIKVPLVKRYKYLGTEVDQELSSNSMVEIVRKKIAARRQTMQWTLDRGGLRFRLSSFV